MNENTSTMYIIKKENIRDRLGQILGREGRELVEKKGGVKEVVNEGVYDPEIKLIPIPENEDWVVGLGGGEYLTAGLSVQLPPSSSSSAGGGSGTDYIELHNHWITEGNIQGPTGQINDDWHPTEEQLEALRHYLKALRITAPDEFNPHEQPPSEVLAWSKVKWLEGILEKVKVHQ
ncbi:hypothetical protein [Salinibacter ruber]|uniref:hypothetical protein n=1 Tax=Salinibacter ruber TaxID=146919 RepID=UPI00216A21A7|nr:hypothetical protein [Salinibacter ruber]